MVLRQLKCGEREREREIHNIYIYIYIIHAIDH